MVPSIARQSVIIKCNMQKSILTGNYEFYYAAGLIANLSGVEIPEDIKPEELLALLSEKIPTLTPADEDIDTTFIENAERKGHSIDVN